MSACCWSVPSWANDRNHFDKTQFGALALVLLLGCAPSAPRERSLATQCSDAFLNADEDPQTERSLAALCSDPVSNGDAARWFASLPLSTQRVHAELVGVVLLIAPSAPRPACARDAEAFAWGCGASRSPYPWVFVTSKERLELSGENSFTLASRDDEFVAASKGCYWAWGQSYDRLESASGPLFAKRSPGKGQSGNDLWISATSWRYVGPRLEARPGTLKAADVNQW